MLEPYSKVRPCPFKCDLKDPDTKRCQFNRCMRDYLRPEQLEVDIPDSKIYVSEKPSIQR